MIRLKNIVMNELGSDGREDDNLAPSSVMSLIVPRKRFADAARALKKEYALLAAEWAADETELGRGFGVFACFRREQEYLVLKTEVPADDPVFPSLTKKYAAAYRFERQIQSLMGLTPA